MADSTAIVIRFIDQCWNARSRTICQELRATDYEHFLPDSEQPTVGPDVYQQLVEGFIEGFPDIHFDIDEAFGPGENACVVWTASCTHRGVFNDIRPTNNRVGIPGVAVAKVIGGRSKRVVSMFDNDSFTKQLGVPAEKAAGSWWKTARSAG